MKIEQKFFIRVVFFCEYVIIVVGWFFFNGNKKNN